MTVRLGSPPMRSTSIRICLGSGFLTGNVSAPATSVIGGNRQRAIMIGDSIHDVEAAHRGGLPAVLVSWGYTAKPASELGAEAVIDRFDALPEALGQIAAR